MFIFVQEKDEKNLIRAFDFYSFFSFVSTKLFMPGAFLVSLSFQKRHSNLISVCLFVYLHVPL